MSQCSPAVAPPEQVRILIVRVPERRWRIRGGGGSCRHPSGMRGDGNDFNSGGAPAGDHRLMANGTRLRKRQQRVSLVAAIRFTLAARRPLFPLLSRRGT